MKRRSFITVTGTLTFGSASLSASPSLGIQIDSPETVRTEIQKPETIIVGLENIQIAPNNLDDSENIIMEIRSTIEDTNVGTIMRRELSFTEDRVLNIPALYVDILDSPNVTSDLLEIDNMSTLTVSLLFLFDHPQINESSNQSFTLSFVSGELENASGFSTVQSADTKTISLNSVSGTGGSEMAVWDNSRYDQNQSISATPSFDNFASGNKGKGVFDLEGRKFGTNASDNAGESSLNEPPTKVTRGAGDPKMSLWDKSRKSQMKRQGDSPSYDNFASDLKGKGINHLDGRNLNVSPSTDDGERNLTKPSSSVINS